MERVALSPPERRRREFLYAISLVVPLTGILTALAFLAGFLLGGQWQLLALALLNGAMAGLFLFARLWLGRDRLALAAVWMGLIGALWPAGFALLIAGAGQMLLLLALATPVGMIVFGAPSGFRPRLALWLEGLFGALAVVWLEFASPIERLAIGAHVRWLLPAAALLVGALVVLPASGYPLRIRRRLAWATLLAVVVPLLVVGAGAGTSSGSEAGLGWGLWLVSLGLGLGLTLVVTHAVARTILSPLQALRTGLAASTPEAERAPLPVFYEDEIGALTTALNEAMERWRGERQALERQVGEQARALERRALQARAVSEIARRATQAGADEDVLAYAAHLLLENFDLYHAGIYLLEEDGEFAVLQAAGDEAGRVMAANRYRVARGSNNLVGMVAESGELQLIADVSTAPSYVHNPLLPYTLSEVALPLKTGDRLVGVLDLHSEKADVFVEDEITVLQAVADYLAMVIERRRLQEELQGNRVEMERLFQQLLGRTWRAEAYAGRQVLGYRATGARPEPLDSPGSEEQETLQSGRTMVFQREEGSLLATPIKLRGQALGVLTLRYATGETPPEMVAFIEAAAERLALALENARLLEEAQCRAAREQLIAEMSARLRATLDLENVLQTAVREFQQSFGLKEAEIRIQILEESPEVRA